MRATEFIVEGVSEGLLEAREGTMREIIRKILPTWPEYVIKDWISSRIKNQEDLKNLTGWLVDLNKMVEPNSWKLHQKMFLTFDMLNPRTRYSMKTKRQFGARNPFLIPRDEERNANAEQLVKTKGMENLPPVTMIQHSNGLELCEGWHRTMAAFRLHPEGFHVNAWIGQAGQQGVAEGKLIESAVFLNPTTVIVGQAHGQPLELSPNTLKQIQAIAAKHGAYYEGNGTDRAYTKGQIDRYVGSWDDEVAKTANPNDPKWLYVLFANVDANNRVQRVGVDPKDTIFNRLLATAKDNSFQGIGYTSQALQKFLQMSSEGKYDFVKMSQQPATQENLTRFLKAGEALMWPSNWEQYPNKAGKIAKAATVDVRDQYLATRKAGVYVTGSGHLKAVQNITGKQGVAEDN